MKGSSAEEDTCDDKDGGTSVTKTMEIEFATLVPYVNDSDIIISLCLDDCTFSFDG